MKIKPFIFGFAVLSVFFGIILGFQAAGVWSTSGKFNANGSAIQPSASDASTIKGWMTLEQVVTAYGVSLSDILTQFNLPENTLISTPIKDLESDNFETSALIEWLQNRSLDNIVSTATPEAALITQAPLLDETQIVDEETLSVTEHVSPERMITGKTTFQELLDWGVTMESIQTILGSPLMDPGLIIKDYASSIGLAFGDIKTKLQIEVDKMN